jgi:hypothetical protein
VVQPRLSHNGLPMGGGGRWPGSSYPRSPNFQACGNWMTPCFVMRVSRVFQSLLCSWVSLSICLSLGVISLTFLDIACFQMNCCCLVLPSHISGSGINMHYVLVQLIACFFKDLFVMLSSLHFSHVSGLRIILH